MKTAIIDNDKIVIKPSPDIHLDGRSGAIVKVLGCGLCGSDIVKFVHKISKNGTVLGHEIVAEIVEINSSTRFKIGDVIVTSHHIPCGNCIYCKHGSVSMCEHFKSTNIIPGGFSEYVYLSEEHLNSVAHPKPENLTEIEASFYEPLGCCVRAIKRTQLHKGDSALVIGLGSIGLIMAQALKTCEINTAGCDLLDARVDILKNYSITSYNVKDIPSDYKADAIFMTSGSDRAIETALKYVRNGGKILVFSSTPNNFGYANNEIYYKELTVLGSYSPSPADLNDSLGMLKSGAVKVNGLSTVYELDDIQKAFDDTMSNKIMKAYIKIKD